MRLSGKSEQAGLALLYLGLGLAGAFVWSRIADLPRLPSWHMEMIYGTAPAPNQYRPLTPWIAELLCRVLPGHNLHTSYLLLRGLVTGVTLLLFDRYLRTWFRPGASAAGALCLGAIIPFTYLRVVQESDPISLLVFVFAFWALARERDGYLFPLVLVGTLNRETTAMIPALYALARWGTAPVRQIIWRTIALALSWAAVYAMLLLIYGRRPYYCDVVMVWQNLGSWVPTACLLLLFGVMWVLPFLGPRSGPTILRRALWLLLPYVALHYVVARVVEVRLFLVFAPVVIPLSWWRLFPAERSPTKESTASAGPITQ